MVDFPEERDELWPLLASVKRGARYVGGEWGTLPLKPDAPGLVRLCLAFPDVYEVGMSYLGFQILYRLVKSLSYADVERAYCPWPDMEQALRSKGMGLGSLESGKVLGDFDVVGFTLQYELTYTNLLTMLDLGKIPLHREDRGDKDPLVFAGGPGALVPEPLASFVDVFCVGDGEELLPQALAILSELRGSPRELRLEALASLPGIYVPAWALPGGPRGFVGSRGMVLPVERRWVADLDRTFFPEHMMIPSLGVVHDRVPVEVFRGCTRGCRFCQAGMVTRPVRERSPETIGRLALSLLEDSGCRELGLLSLATCDYRRLDELLALLVPELERRRASLSLPSLRIDGFSVDLATRLEGVRRGSLTFAPEAGTERLRRVINKGLSDGEILSTVEAAFRHGWERIKFYFMMGLPTESDMDLEGLEALVRECARIGRATARGAQIAVSVAGFVPKAHTPFQWEEQSLPEDLRDRGRRIKSGLRKERSVKVAYHEPAQTFLEGVFARGGRECGAVLERAWRGGARFDGWDECFRFDLWEEAFRREEIDPRALVSRPRGRDEVFPWDHIDAGVSREFLLRERDRAYDELLSPDCRTGKCQGCGLEGRCTPSGIGGV